MLKCPRCGARVKGPDLLTGVCAACQQRLSESVSGSADFNDGDKTFVSGDDAESAVEGSSLDSDFRRGADAKSQNLFSAGLGDSFDLGLTPAAAADGVPDRDTDAHATDAGSDSGGGDDSRQSDAANLKTFVSDQWSDDSSASAAEPDVQQTAPAEENDRTYVSEKFLPVDEEAQRRTLVGDDLGAGDDGDGGDATAADKTFVGDFSAPDRTISLPAQNQDLASDQTFVSDEVPEALVRTLQSNFDDGEDGPASRTLKGKEVERLPGPRIRWSSRRGCFAI